MLILKNLFMSLKGEWEGDLLQVALDTQYWTAFNHVLTWGSIAIYFPFTLGLCSDGFFNLFPSQAPFIGMHLEQHFFVIKNSTYKTKKWQTFHS